MDAEKLGEEVIQLWLDVMSFFGENSAELLTADDNLKQKVREKRIEVFEKLIPKIEAYKSLNKEDAQTFGFVLLGELMQFSEDADEETEKLGALLDDFEHEDDDYRKDVLALNLLVMFFIDDDADEMEEEIAELSEHVGI